MAGGTGAADPVAAYKSLLRDLIDRRPSGTRGRIALALGKHKSFVSQITNPAYAVPVPAKHLPLIFELGHFSPEERRRFIAAYRKAHPDRSLQPADPAMDAATALTIRIPAALEPRRRAELTEAIQLFAQQAIALALKWEARDTAARTADAGAAVDKAGSAPPKAPARKRPGPGGPRHKGEAQ
ncbi:MAG: hypothetical protein RIB84_02275 [Sneathiellaceae bacterium]